MTDEDLEELTAEIAEKKAEIAQLDASLRTYSAEIERKNDYIKQLYEETRCVTLEPTDNLFRIWGEEGGHEHWQYVIETSFETAIALYIETQESPARKIELVARGYCITSKTTATPCPTCTGKSFAKAFGELTSSKKFVLTVDLGVDARRQPPDVAVTVEKALAAIKIWSSWNVKEGKLASIHAEGGRVAGIMEIK